MTDRCLCPETFSIGDAQFTASEVIALLGEYVSPERKVRIDEVIAERSYTVVPVMEGLFDRGNVSAVIRSGESLGFQAMHIIESCEFFKEAKRVTQGADKWLDVQRWETMVPCIEDLKAKGYRILATHFEDATPLDEVDWTQPSALVFGNEKDGVTDELLEMADERVTIPMAGFSQSFNISVAAALCLYHIRNARIAKLGHHGDLTEVEQERLRADYYIKSIVAAEQILERKGQDGDRE